MAKITVTPALVRDSLNEFNERKNAMLENIANDVAKQACHFINQNLLKTVEGHTIRDEVKNFTLCQSNSEFLFQSEDLNDRAFTKIKTALTEAGFILTHSYSAKLIRFKTEI